MGEIFICSGNFRVLGYAVRGQTECMVNVSGHARSLQQELAEAVVESQRVSELRNSARELQSSVLDQLE